MGLLLGVDAGTTALKAGLFDEAGRQIAVTAEEYALCTPEPARAELDPETYWRATVAAVRRVLGTAGVRGSDVRALAVSSQGETVIPVRADGRPVGPAIVWLDNRAVEEARELGERFDPATLYAATGVPALVPTWTACKLLWWQRNDRGLFDRAARFLLVEDFLLQRFTGRFATDGGVQCTTLLYDIVARTWWEPMLDCIGLGVDRLGELVAPGEVVGTLTPSAADALGLAPSVLVVAGGMDQGAGAVGVGNVGPGIVSESTGGALTIQASVDRHGGDPGAQTPVYVHSASGLYLYCPVSPTGGMALTWFRDRFGEPEVSRARELGRDAYELLTELAAAAPPGADGLTMLPHLQGAFSPEYEPAARGAFYGLTLAHGRAHAVRAILESVAFMLRRNLEALAGAGAAANEVRSHGGGARSALWNQMKADVCGLPVVTLEGSDAAIRGDAMLAGVAAGAFPDLGEAARRLIRVAARFEPDARTRAAYDEAYGRYVELFDALRPMYRWTGVRPGVGNQTA